MTAYQQSSFKEPSCRLSSKIVALDETAVLMSSMEEIRKQKALHRIDCKMELCLTVGSSKNWQTSTILSTEEKRVFHSLEWKSDSMIFQKTSDPPGRVRQWSKIETDVWETWEVWLCKRFHNWAIVRFSCTQKRNPGCSLQALLLSTSQWRQRISTQRKRWRWVSGRMRWYSSFKKP